MGYDAFVKKYFKYKAVRYFRKLFLNEWIEIRSITEHKGIS